MAAPLVRWTATAAAVLLLAGCGSTVATSGNPRGDALSGTGPGSSLTGPGGASAGPNGGLAPGTNVGGTLSGNGSGGTGSTGSAGGGAGSATGATGSAGTAAEAGDGPGVTRTSINIAAAYEPDAAAADSALGAADANPGDLKAETEAVIKYVNSHGGVARRKVVPIWYKASVSDDAATTDQRSCSQWTQDHKVFVMTAGTPIWDECTAKAGAIAVDTGRIVEETTALNHKYPQDINLTSFTIDHSMTATINGLARQGYFSKGAKVGVVTWDSSYYRYGISTAANPALARLGLHNVPVQYVAVPQSYGDLGATSSSAGSAVLRFRTMGIDHVILFDGPAGVNSSGVLVLEWMQQANSQHYYPKHGLNSTSAFNGLAGDYPQQEMVGSLGVGWAPSLEQTQQDFDAAPKSANTKLCLKIMKDAGQQQSGANAQGIQFAICDGLFFLKQAFDPITGPLNRQTALAAINAMGTRFDSTVTFGVDVTASRHDAAYLVRNVAFFTSCSCYHYTSKPYDPF